MGRRPKPTAIKILQGNPGKRALNRREPRPCRLEAALARPPAWLAGEGRELWDRLVPALAAQGLATEADVEALALLCSSWGDWRAACDALAVNGATMAARSGARVPRPEVAIAARASRRVREWLTEFGLTPAARRGRAPLPTNPQADPMAELLEVIR